MCAVQNSCGCGSGPPYHQGCLWQREQSAREAPHLAPPRRTHCISPAGIMLSSQFPINYFAVSEVDQSFPEFNAVFADVGELPGSKAAWYFRRTEDYGYKGENESADDLGRQFALEW